MADRFYKDKLREKMLELFQKNRREFVRDIPTLMFMNSFPGMSQSKLNEIKAMENNRGQDYANMELIDYIMKKDDFWKKYLETAKEINECATTCNLIFDDFAKNVPHPDKVYEQQRRKEMEFACEERNYHMSESSVVTQPSEDNTASKSTPFSTKIVLANLGKTTHDDEVSGVPIKQEEEDAALTDAYSEEHNHQETFLNPIGNHMHEEPAGVNESSDSNTSNTPFSAKAILANLCETSNATQPSVTVKPQAECTNYEADDSNLNRDGATQGVVKPIGQKDLQLSYLNDSIMESNEGNDGDETDSGSFVVSDTDFEIAFDDPSQAHQIDSLRLAKENQCMATNQESFLTKKIDEGGNTLQNEKKLNEKPLASQGFSMSSTARKETVPTSGGELNNTLISSDDSFVDNCFDQPTAEQATEIGNGADRTAACANDIDRQAVAAAVGNDDDQTSPKTYYNNCVIINSRHCQIDSKGCTIKESGKRKPFQGIAAPDVQPSLNQVDVLMVKNVNIGNTHNSNSTRVMQNTSENNFEIENEDIAQYPTVTPSNRIETSPEGNRSEVRATLVNNRPLEVSNRREVEDNGEVLGNGREVEGNREILGPDRDIEAGNCNVQSAKVDLLRSFSGFFPRWLRFEWNF